MIVFKYTEFNNLENRVITRILINHHKRYRLLLRKKEYQMENKYKCTYVGELTNTVVYGIY